MRYLSLPVVLAVITSWLLPASTPAQFPSYPEPNHPLAVTAAALHPVAAARHAAARARSGTWTVRSGQTLSGIAAAAYGSAGLWPALWWVNKARVRNPDLILTGQVLRLSSWHPRAAWLYRAGKAADGPAAAPAASTVYQAPARQYRRSYHRAYSPARHAAPRYYGSVHGSVYSFGALERLWVSAGGPSWAAGHAAEIAECESGGNVYAHNPSGATGLWQILGAVVPGNLYDPYVNALNAVAKFRASGSTFAAWVCR
jgi:LysM domain